MADYQIDEQPEVQQSMKELKKKTREMEVEKDDADLPAAQTKGASKTPNGEKKVVPELDLD